MTENFEKTVHISKKGSDNEVTMDLTLHLIYKLKSFQKKKSVVTLNLFPFQRLNTTVNITHLFCKSRYHLSKSCQWFVDVCTFLKYSNRHQFNLKIVMGKTQFTIMEVIMIIVAYRLIFVLKCTRSITL